MSTIARPGHIRLRLLAMTAAAGLGVSGAARADTTVADADLSRLTIEQLGDIEITSVSKRPEAIGRAPSAVYVITNEDIRRSGAVSLPEALRLAPNLEVMRIDALDYTITARGFAGLEAANKLLVLIDGRSVYTPLYSGVDWDQQHVLLDDVDRIEVVSGPGGALWGANAVNGVINVITRPAQETQGLLLSASGGSLDQDVRFRYGGRLGEAAAFRIYATGFKRGDLETATGASTNDGWKGGQAGFRFDWAGMSDAVTVQGDLQDSAIDQSLGVAKGYVRAHNLLGRYAHKTMAGGEVELQAYYDHNQREARLTYDALTTWDVSLQQSLAPRGAHAFVWGAGFRQTSDDFMPLTGPQLLDPGSRRATIGNLFVQDEIAVSDEVTLTLGIKAEDNSYTELDYMPSVRLAWRPGPRTLVWAAVSRAIRNPSRIERDFSIPGLVEPHLFQSEDLIAYEAGVRRQVAERATLSVSLFYNDYDHLRTNEFVPGRTPPIFVGNTMQARVYGMEAWGTLDVTDWWRLSGGVTLLDKSLKLKPGSLDVAQFEAGGVDPDAWGKLRSQMQLGDRVDLDIHVRAYGKIPTLLASGYSGAPGYTEVAARLGWRITDRAELSIIGQNLLHERHPEASESRRSEVPRSVMAGLRVTY